MSGSENGTGTVSGAGSGPRGVPEAGSAGGSAARNTGGSTTGSAAGNEAGGGFGGGTGSPGTGSPGTGKLSGQFFDAALDLLRRVRDEEDGNIHRAAGLIADTVAAGGRLFTFGAGHSSLPAQDVVYRAGGLALMNLLPVPGAVGVDVVPATLGSALERVEGLASAVLDTGPVRAGDLLVVISLSGRNTLPVEMARHAKELGLTVVGVTSVAYAEGTAPRNPWGTFLKDHCDVVLDSKIAVGDAELAADGIDAPFAPASTVVTSALMQAVVATAAGELAARGITPPMLRSGNVDGGHAWNAQVMSDYGDRIFYRR
ncbi:SIS domain-containing protein [Streptomyces lycii]|uniref:SIS domain-containing protein n=1 Tax=Streptomyces lycii TaxID=2654337 RepID=A0ABQ7F895_9ACTN|nr:SIS domain-containing protein [Streptomyces lycii]KAF4405076.1 SIS domain-containing protein [Streptomyces lycii]